MANWLAQLFGSRNQRLLSGYNRSVARTNAQEESFKTLSDEQLQGKTAEFRQRLAGGEDLEKLLPEAFAAVREASRTAAKASGNRASRSSPPASRWRNSAVLPLSWSSLNALNDSSSAFVRATLLL